MASFLAKYKKRINVPDERRAHILSKHPEVATVWSLIEKTLETPDEVRRSTYDNKVWLYYKFYKKNSKYLSVVVRIYNGEGLLLTSYLTDRIKLGEKL